MRIKFIQKLIDKMRNKCSTKEEGKEICYVKYFKDPNARVDCNCVIGDYTYIGPLVDITKAKIGRYCSIAPRALIGMGEHDINEISINHMLSELNCSYEHLTKDDIEIGNDVWIGANAVIRRGVKIGDHAIVGALSFVNKDVPDFAVVAGIPAKIIKYRFDDEMRAKIQKSKYWEYEPDEAKKIIENIKKG